MIWYTVISQAGKKCPWCDKAMALLDEKGEAYHIRSLPRTKLLEEADRAKMNTVPIIYHGIRLIGGYDDLVEYLEADR